jgi:peptidoglycan hydrolase-like protein with peptidoglycan-binding domain
VVKLQRLLRARGFQSVKTTGRYDRATRSAVGRFQQRRGLKADRIVGPSTWRELRRPST